VSTASVSLVVNGKAAGRLKPDVVARIEAAVQELGYRPALRAQELALGTVSTVGIIVPDIGNPYFGLLLAGMAEALGVKHPLTVTIPPAGREYGLNEVRQAMLADLGALVLTSPSLDVVAALQPEDNVVLLDAPGAPPHWRSVVWDMQAACRDMADHLAGQGHSKIAYLGLEHGPQAATLKHRRELVETELRRVGASVVEDLTIVEASAIEALSVVRERIEASLARGVTALVVEDDWYALGVLNALESLGIEVPRRLAVVAFNDGPVSTVSSPSLSSVSLDARQLGRLAGEMASDVVRGAERSPRRQVLASRFVERASTRTT